MDAMEAYKRKKAELFSEPGMIYGRDFSGESTDLGSLKDKAPANVIISGKITEVKYHVLRGDHMLVNITVEDEAGNQASVRLITYLCFENELRGHLQLGITISVRGLAALDHFDGSYGVMAVTGIKTGSI